MRCVIVDRVRLAISMEGIAAYPQSSDGRLAGSDPETTTLGEVIEDRYSYDDDDCFEGITRLDKAAQAGMWRQRIESVCNAAEMAALRIYFATEGKVLEHACEVLGCIIRIDGRSEHYVMTECWILAKQADKADGKVAECVLDIYHSANKKALRAVDR